MFVWASLFLARDIRISNSKLRSPFRGEIFVFCMCYLAAQRLTLGRYRGARLAHVMLVTPFFINFRPKGQQNSCYEVESQSLDELLVGFEAGTFRSCYKTLGHSLF